MCASLLKHFLQKDWGLNFFCVHYILNASSLANVSENPKAESWNTDDWYRCVHMHVKLFKFANKLVPQAHMTALASCWYVPDKYKTKMVRNPSWEMQKSEWTNWGWRTHKLGVGLNQVQLSPELTCASAAKAKVCLDIPLSSKKYASMGLRCIFKVLGVSEEKLHALEGFVPPTDFQVSWRIWLR